MNISNTGRLSAIAAVAILLATTSSASAASAPSPSPSAVGPTVTVLDRLDCSLQRIGTQFVRCDKLTGAGKAAPEWVPEQSGPIEYR